MIDVIPVVALVLGIFGVSLANTLALRRLIIRPMVDDMAALCDAIRRQRDTLAHLVDTGDLDGARQMAGEILGGGKS